MKIYLYTVITLLLHSCAQIVPLTGGERDISAPKIIKEKSTPKQGQLNYSQPEMTLVFDEYIVLKNPINTITVTPQPKVPPTITAKNKKLKLVFNEPLLANTTYSVSFNGAITDLSEGNDSLFQYVFSTGSFIDSLEFSGKIVNAFTNKPESGILVGLYPVNDSIDVDSIPFKVKPTYITQSSESGDYMIKYIKTGSYNAFAFTDNNRDLLFNPPTEKIGFIDSLYCCFDTVSANHKIRLFNPLSEEQGLKSVTLEYPGKLTLVFKESDPKNFSISHFSPLLAEKTETNDSIIYWLTEPYNRNSFFEFRQNSSIDTLKPIYKNIPKNQDILPLTVSNNLHEGKLLPFDTLALTFNEPIKIIDETLIKAYNLDSNLIPVKVFIKNLRTLQVLPESDSALYYNIDSSAILSTLTFSSNTNLSGNFLKHAENYYGKLLVQLEVDSASSYVLELLDLSGVLIRKVSFTNESSVLTFENIIPGSYQLRLINDFDSNGIWSTGELYKKQPEKVYYYQKPIKVRSNWDMEIEWITNN
ncbi:MAG: Ig-like domain-containing protein [Crocinitomicaceae bacterium]